MSAAMGEQGARAESARLFVGLMLPEELAEPLLAGARATLLEGEGPRAVRLVRADELHLTLAFLGDVPRERVGGLAAALAHELLGLFAPELRLGPTGAFPERGAPRVLWVGLREAPGRDGRLESLHRAVGRAVTAKLGPLAEPTEAWRPHLTVARGRRGVRGPARAALRAFRALAFELAWTPGEVALVESHLERRTERYEVLGRFPLVGEAGV